MSVILTGMDMPGNCKKCPCKYFTEGAWLDFCQATNMEIKEGTAVLDNCPMKTVDGLIEQIRRKANSGQWSNATVYGMRKAIAIIKEYCGEENKQNG